MEINVKFLILQVKTKNYEKKKKKYNELWNGIKNKIEIINDGECKYGKDFTKIKYDTNDDLPIN